MFIIQKLTIFLQIIREKNFKLYSLRTIIILK